MITHGMVFKFPDGIAATLLARPDGGWNVEKETGLRLSGITDAQAEQMVNAATLADHRAAAAARINAHALAIEIDMAHEAALRENEKRSAKALARAMKFVPGTDARRYNGVDASDVSAALLLFIEAHYHAISAGVKSLAQFKANYEEAGHTYVDGMPGVHQCPESCWFDTFVITLDGTPIPSELLLEIATLQTRCGIRQGQASSVGQTKGIYCNALAWELIRRGATIGPRK